MLSTFRDSKRTQEGKDVAEVSRGNTLRFLNQEAKIFIIGFKNIMQSLTQTVDQFLNNT